MKAYIFYEGVYNNYICYLVLENYIVISRHICSDLDFMAYDLWNRKSRNSLREEITKQYGEIEIVHPPLNFTDNLFHIFREKANFNYIYGE